MHLRKRNLPVIVAAIITIGCITVSAQTLTTLHSFNGGDGRSPEAALVQGSDGNFYGTTVLGGAHLKGTVFKIDATGSLTTLHSFSGSPGDGAVPFAGLVQGSDGNFYGTTASGGAFFQGTVFRMTPSGAITVLHSFNSFFSEGAVPFAALVQGSDGNFYGTTAFGGMAIDALTYVALGGLYGASLYIARASDPLAARADADLVVDTLISGLLRGAG